VEAGRWLGVTVLDAGLMLGVKVGRMSCSLFELGIEIKVGGLLATSGV
jgi:hypothetical protein